MYRNANLILGIYLIAATLLITCYGLYNKYNKIKGGLNILKMIKLIIYWLIFTISIIINHAYIATENRLFC